MRNKIIRKWDIQVDNRKNEYTMTIMNLESQSKQKVLTSMQLGVLLLVICRIWS